jgi:pyrroline-5-carboxylate reductase
MPSEHKIALIGCGKMGEKFAEKLKATFYFYDNDFEKANNLQKKGLGKACATFEEAIDSADLVILAIKPQNLKEFHVDIKDRTLISILAGTPLSKLKKHIIAKHTIRLMPNLAILHGKGAIAVVSDKKDAKLEGLLSPLGKLFWLKESEINAFTAISSSGIAYVFSFIQAMEQAALKLGFSPVQSKVIIEQTLLGASSLYSQSDKPLKEWINEVASKGGTTEAGLKLLDMQGVTEAFFAANVKAQELENE